ncbi:dual specificity phosphatase, catalytic domain-containing protein [Phthorimaea operculella]|nr:dual specificity phosphatase, catalytic domain-containing protein [Phthorimaea operculella]
MYIIFLLMTRCFGVLYLNLSPRDALRPFYVNGQTYRPFQDATQGDSVYTITLMDCLCALTKAHSLGFFNFKDFNYEEYERLDKIQGGDLNWIVPAKFLAFIGPVDYSVSLFHPPEMYIDYFKENNVRIVIRLNKRMYDGDVFSNAGITHYDLFFPDGSCPPRHILMKFLQIAEEAECAIAVHCKAGLGRTGSLIGCYLIKHYRMTAHEAIGWMRICRPGSVIGHQQGWLEHLEPWLIKQGNLYRKRMFQDTEMFPVHEYGVYSIAAKIMKQRPLLIGKGSSSPPISQRPSRSNAPTPSRQLASKAREAPSKTKEPTQHDRHLKPIPKMVTSRGSQHSKESAEVSTRGAGEPRIGPSRTSTVKSNSNNREPSSPIPTFRTSQGSVIKTLSDAKTFLMKSSIYTQQKERDRQLHSAMLVSPLKFTGNHSERENAAHTQNNNTSSFSYNSTPQHPRRRLPLGRSPSPSPSPSPTRGVTSAQTALAVKELASIREALANLSKNRKPSSIGGASVGASSLGACRDAPAGKRAPSVRSDERPTATQGDMLNSIKFQRRYRDVLSTEKVYNEKGRTPGVSNVYSSKVTAFKDRNSSRAENRSENSTEGSRSTNPPWRPSSPNYVSSLAAPYCNPRPSGYLPENKKISSPKERSPSNSINYPKDKSPPSANKFSTPTRPTSPKGRTRTTSYY